MPFMNTDLKVFPDPIFSLLHKMEHDDVIPQQRPFPCLSARTSHLTDAEDEPKFQKLRRVQSQYFTYRMIYKTEKVGTRNLVFIPHTNVSATARVATVTVPSIS
jgi:hypothetical protein